MKKNKSKKMQRGGILGFFEDNNPTSTYAQPSTYESTYAPAPAPASTSFWSSIKKNLPTTSSWSLFGDSQNKTPSQIQMPPSQIQMQSSYGGKKRPRNKTKKRKTRRRKSRRN